MQLISLHTSWPIERRDTLSLGYCFNANINMQGKPIPNQDTMEKG